MDKRRFRVLLLITTVLLASCGGATIEDYAEQEPAFVAEAFFNGPLLAYGVIKNRAGKVTRRFTATLEGSWENGSGLLAERFVFDDGEIQYRNWRLVPKGAGGIPDGGSRRFYDASAEDVIGEATLTTRGNAAFIQYTLQVPYGDRQINVRVDDRMYLINEQVLIGESTLTKWGFHVGDILLTIIKSDPGKTTP